MRRRTSSTMRRRGIVEGYSVERRRVEYRGPTKPGDASSAQVAYGQYVIAEYRRRVDAGLPAAPYLTEQEFEEQHRRERRIGRMPCGS